MCVEVLHKACGCGDLKEVQKLLYAGEDVNAVDNQGRNPVFYAAEGGHSEIVETLINSGADVDVLDKNGMTPLCAACKSRSVDVVKVLVEKGADIHNIASSIETLPIHVACRQCCPEIVQFLIEKGSVLELTDADGLTPLHLVCSAECSEEDRVCVMKSLLNQGIDISTTDQEENTLLHKAVLNCGLEFVQLLVQFGCDRNATNRDGNTPLMLACRDQKWDVAKYLLENHAVLIDENRFGESAETFALRNGNLEIVKMVIEKGVVVKNLLAEACVSDNVELIKFLLESGADVNAKIRYGVLPIHTAASVGNIEVLKMLCNAGADVHAITRLQETPLHFASSKRDNVDAIQFLLDHGDTVAVSDITGQSPLHVCTGLNNMTLLVDSGADVNVLDNGGYSPILHQCKCGDVETVNFLVNLGANASTGMHVAALHNHVDVISKLLEFGFEVNSSNDTLGTPLHCANSDETVVFLLKHGADVNALKNNNETPLFCCIRDGHKFIAMILMERGADTSISNAENETPLHLACRLIKDSAPLIDLLIESGCDIHAIDAKGRTPFLHACGYSDLHTVRKLLELGAKMDSRDNDGQNALHYAASNGDMDLITFLFQFDNELNCPDAQGLRPIARCRHTDAGDFFYTITRVVSPEEMDSLMLSPFWDEQKFEFLKTLIKDKAQVTLVDDNLNTPLHYAALAGDVFSMELLLENGADCNAVNNCGQTPIYCAIDSPTFDAVRLLLSAKADTRIVDNLGRTPVDYAFEKRPRFFKFFSMLGEP